MKTLLGIIFFLAGIFVGLYVGVYVLFWGGAITAIHAIGDGAFWLFIWGMIKFFLAAPLGWLLFMFFGLISSAFFE